MWVVRDQVPKYAKSARQQRILTGNFRNNGNTRKCGNIICNGKAGTCRNGNTHH